MRKIEVDIRYIQKTRERGRRQTKRGRYASLVCCSQQAGQGCLEVYETRRKRDARHLRQDKRRGFGDFGFNYAGPGRSSKRKGLSDSGSSFVLIEELASCWGKVWGCRAKERCRSSF